MKRSAQAIYNLYEFESVPAAGESVKRVATRLKMGKIPQFDREDLFPSSANGLNKATSYDFSPNFLDGEDVHKFDEATVRYQIAAGAYMGGRIIRQTDLPHFKFIKSPPKQSHRLPEKHYLNVRSEALHGLHGVNPMVKQSMQKQKVLTTGAHNAMRAFGFERDDNDKIFPRLPTGLPMSVETQRDTLDAERINSNMVQPISVFPGIGF